LAGADLVDDGPCGRLGFLSYTGAATPLATSAIKVFHNPEATGAAADTSTGPPVADARVTSYSLPGAMDMDLLLRYDTANNKKLHKTMDQLRKVRADRRKAESAACGVEDHQTAAQSAQR